ncbi:MAG: hypothetical protein RML12_06930 [Xanthomonadales bacterium]|nr:hypothetical protein [Xanthomonadales bacterium]
MAGPAGALEGAGDAARRADLDRLRHRRQVHAEVEARGRHHRPQPAAAQALLDRGALLGRQRAVMEPKLVARPRPDGGQGREPLLGEGAGVAEHEAGRRREQPLEHLRQQLEAVVAE